MSPDRRRGVLLGFAAAARHHYADYRELLLELMHLRAEYRLLRAELDQLRRLNAAASVHVRPDGARLH